ncbi:MAG: nicotinate-nucleotide adenylyltransferase [Bacteroidia bacterium]|nr:nicotinate-nucleotide adenylyltransferase [Bacteroidia bacterium]MCF8427280.1 nicotinate-nucleotide adenylyltransferase [Bacteroidia bacterium]MCF8447412.1 nicotinate-nucleotide adenylyltransferase [Bacteroidia bacterium]
MQIGLFFGSFNPVHTGHLIIANYMADYAQLDEIWFVVSPLNPFKANDKLLGEELRLNLLKLAIHGDPRFKACDIEFKLPRPSYTADTLKELRDANPEHSFTLIIGGDNLKGFHYWKDYEDILLHHKVFVYARVGIVEAPLLSNHPSIKLFEVPLLNISSTYIRETIKAGKSIRYLVPLAVREEIAKNGYYLA